MKYLEIKNVLKKYGKRHDKIIAVNNLSFEVNEGEILSIIGPNGAGKTTLIGIMCGLLYPDSGKVLFQTKEINSIYSKYTKKIGAVLEGNRNIYWYLSAFENIKYFGRLYLMNDKTIIKKAKELFEFFNLSQFMHEKVGNFSRGMQQKVAICIALINEPDILFLDEPTLGLDVMTNLQMIDILGRLVREFKTTIILTTHRLEVSEKLSDRIMILEKGKILHLENTLTLKDFFNEESYCIQIEGCLSIENKNEINLFLKKNINAFLNVTFNEKEFLSIIKIDLKKDRQSAGKNLESFISFLVSTNRNILSLEKTDSSLEEIFIRIFKNQGT